MMTLRTIQRLLKVPWRDFAPKLAMTSFWQLLNRVQRQ